MSLESEAKGRDRAVRHAVHRVIEIAGVATAAFLAYFVVPLDGDLGEFLAGAFVIVSAAALIPLSIRRAREVLVSDQPMLVAAQSLITTITLLIVAFASAYYVLGIDHQDQMSGISTKIDALYFTVTVASTVGFGDITAVGQGARALVTGHMIVNLLFVAIAVRVVSWALKQREATVTTKQLGS